MAIHGASRQEIRHSIQGCLLRLMDQADAHPELDGEGLQLWLEYELEALRPRPLVALALNMIFQRIFEF